MTDLTDVSSGDLVTSARQNLINDYIQDAMHKINTLSIDISGTEVIDGTRYVKPVRIINPSGGLLFYDSTGSIPIAKLDDGGNLFLLGGVVPL